MGPSQGICIKCHKGGTIGCTGLCSACKSKSNLRYFDIKQEEGTSFMIFPNEAARILDIMDSLNASGSRRDQDELKGILKVLGLFNISEEMLRKVANVDKLQKKF